MPAGSTSTNHTRTDLIGAAAIIFERDGYARAKVSDICRSAGVTKGALYFYFSSKKALAAEVLNRRTQEWGRARRQPSVAHHIPLQVLVDLGYAVSLRTGPDLTTAGVHRLLFQSPLCEELAEQQIDQWIGVVRDLLLAAESEGALYPDLDLQEAAEAVVTALIGMQVASIAMADFDDVTQRTAMVWRMWIPALAPPDVPPHAATAATLQPHSLIRAECSYRSPGGSRLNDLADGRRTRDRLIAASIELFDRDGFARTSLDAVCRAVRVTKGALYRHFPSKLALAAAVVEEHFRVSHGVRAAVEAVGLSPLQALIDMTYLMCRLAGTNRTVRVGVRLLFTSELFDLLASTYCVSVATMIRDLLRDAVEVGQVQPDVDVREEAEGLMTVIIGAQLRTVVSAGESGVDGQLTMLWQRQVDRLVPAGQRDRLRTQPPPL